MIKLKHIEGIKTTLIIALFLSTMLLLYFNWENPNAEAFRLPQILADEETTQAPLPRDVVQPQKIVVNFGAGAYTQLEPEQFDSWNECIRAVGVHSRGGAVLVEEITRDQYDRIMEFRSIRFGFGYELPFGSFCRQYDIPLAQGFSQIETVREIGYSSGSPESLFIADELQNKYYRIVAETQTSHLSALITAIEKGSYITCYPIGTFVGTGNKTVLPLPFESSLAPIEFEPEFFDTGTLRVREFAQTFFGESFDFVRRIEESKGTVIYMYGYGEKVLTINPAGSVEYKEKSSIPGGQQDYFDALSGALQFVSSHGAFQPPGSELTPYLKESKAIERDKRKGYLFVFGMKTPAGSLNYAGSEAITIEIMGGQVTHYKRDMISLKNQEGTPRETEPEEVYSAVNMLAGNYQFINTVLVAEGYPTSPAEGEVLFDFISDRIRQVKTGYVRPGGAGRDENELIPAWVVIVDDITFYFDLFNAEPLGYNKSVQ